MIRSWKHALLGLVFFLTLFSLQWSRLFSFHGVVVDWMLLFVIMLSMRFGDYSVYFIAFFSGLLVDITGMGPLGFYAFVYVFVTWCSAGYQKWIQVDSKLAPVLYMLLAVPIKYVWGGFFSTWILGVRTLDLNTVFACAIEVGLDMAAMVVVLFVGKFVYTQHEPNG